MVGVVLLGVDRRLIAEALARHAPGLPVVEVTGTDTGAMAQVVAAAAAAGEPRGHRAAGPRLRVLGHVPRLRPARGPVRRGGRPAGGAPVSASTRAVDGGPATPRRRGACPASPDPATRRPPGRELSWRERLNAHPMAPYYLILGSSMLLLVLGLVMVLSSSTVESIDVSGSAFTLFQRQAMFAAIGVVAMVVLSRGRVPLFRRFALLFLILSIFLLLLTFVPGISAGVHGQRNWIRLFGPFRLQPSEFAKLGLIIWTAHVVASKDRLMNQWRDLFWPVIPVAGAHRAAGRRRGRPRHRDRALDHRGRACCS